MTTLHRFIGPVVIAISIMSSLPIQGAEPFFEKIPVFQGQSHGFKSYRIPGIIVTPKGTMLAYGEARRNGGDWDDTRIILRRSTDGGKTWEPQQILGELGEKLSKNPATRQLKNLHPEGITYNNPVAISDTQTGAVHFLYCLEYMRCFYMRSDDDGLTFSQPVEITSAFDTFRPEYNWAVLATGPGHGIQLKNGRLVVAIWLSLGTGGGAHRPSVTSTIYSDDHGKTWQRGEIAVPNSDDFVNPNETCLTQLSDGRVMLNVRNESPNNRRIVVTSPDGATNWSAPKFQAELVEPICMASILSVPPDNDHEQSLLLFVNPAHPERRRANLTLRVSSDQGKTWPVARTIEEGSSAYSDLAILPDETLLCFYEVTSGPESRRGMFLARFNMDWVRQKASGK